MGNTCCLMWALGTQGHSVRENPSGTAHVTCTSYVGRASVSSTLPPKLGPQPSRLSRPALSSLSGLPALCFSGARWCTGANTRAVVPLGGGVTPGSSPALAWPWGGVSKAGLLTVAVEAPRQGLAERLSVQDAAPNAWHVGAPCTDLHLCARIKPELEGACHHSRRPSIGISLSEPGVPTVDQVQASGRQAGPTGGLPLGYPV